METLWQSFYVYSWSLIAILKPIEYIISEIDHNNITIHSDALSTITSIQNLHYPAEIAKRIQNAHNRAQPSGKNISYSWVPGHRNLTDGTERADIAAKQANSLKKVSSKFHPYISLLIFIL